MHNLKKAFDISQENTTLQRPTLQRAATVQQIVFKQAAFSTQLAKN
jgi:hypothetical protein